MHVAERAPPPQIGSLGASIHTCGLVAPSSPFRYVTPSRFSPSLRTFAVVPLLATYFVSQSSRPRPFMTTSAAPATLSMSLGFGSNVCTSPPFGTRLDTATRSPPTWRTRSAKTVVVATTSRAPDVDGGRVRGRRTPSTPIVTPITASESHRRTHLDAPEIQSHYSGRSVQVRLSLVNAFLAIGATAQRARRTPGASARGSRRSGRPRSRSRAGTAPTSPAYVVAGKPCRRAVTWPVRARSRRARAAVAGREAVRAAARQRRRVPRARRRSAAPRPRPGRARAATAGPRRARRRTPRISSATSAGVIRAVLARTASTSAPFGP